jgi:signal transduction histidine kinase
MKQSLPRSIRDYLQAFYSERHSPAFLQLSPDGLVRGHGGDLERFGLETPPKDAAAADIVVYLEGLFPLKTPSIILPALETAPDVFADIHIFKENETAAWVLFLDTTEHERKLRSIIQESNEWKLKEVEYRKQLCKSIPAQVLEQMNIALFRLVEPQRYEVVGRLPGWFNEMFSRCADVDADGHPQPARCFPFLENFLTYEAAKLWEDHDKGMITSELWIESDPSDREYYLEASALWVKDRKILMIRQLEDEESTYHSHIQKGREKSLAYERLKKSEVLLKSFIANTSHELRTPMNAIMGISKMIINYYGENLTPKQKEGLQLIHQSGQRLLNLINSLLDLSKIEAGKLELLDEPIVMADLLAEMQQMTVALLKDKDKDIAFRLKSAPGIPSRIVVDSEKLNRILVNLLANAVKFTKQGEITLSAYSHGDRLYFSVKDTGIGIDRDHLAGIFDAFTQVDGSMTREHGGTGLGLALCKKLIKLMGGDIRVRSQLNSGSTFNFHIPLVIAEPEQEPGATEN